MHSPPYTSRNRSRGPCSGFTLLEVLISLTILVVAVVGSMSTMTQISDLGNANREATVAYQAARSMMEQIQNVSFDEVFERFNNIPTDDPNGVGTAEGMHFAVPGLDVQAADADGFVGRILLPISPGNRLREDLVDSSFGMPRDLTGDGVIDAFDHRTDKIILPIRIQVQWSGVSGNRTAEFTTTLGDR